LDEFPLRQLINFDTDGKRTSRNQSVSAKPVTKRYDSVEAFTTAKMELAVRSLEKVDLSKVLEENAEK
jgi:hypothetical protein